MVFDGTSVMSCVGPTEVKFRTSAGEIECKLTRMNRTLAHGGDEEWISADIGNRGEG
jgi:hypothetical protein